MPILAIGFLWQWVGYYYKWDVNVWIANELHAGSYRTNWEMVKALSGTSLVGVVGWCVKVYSNGKLTKKQRAEGERDNAIAVATEIGKLKFSIQDCIDNINHYIKYKQDEEVKKWVSRKKFYERQLDKYAENWKIN